MEEGGDGRGGGGVKILLLVKTFKELAMQALPKIILFPKVISDINIVKITLHRRLLAKTARFA